LLQLLNCRGFARSFANESTKDYRSVNELIAELEIKPDAAYCGARSPFELASSTPECP